MKGREWRKYLIGLVAMVTALVFSLIPVVGVYAANPTVTITVTAGTVSITNTQSSWAMGYATVSEVLYFSANNAQDDDYSQIANTGSLACDIEIQGVNFEGGEYDWTLGAASANVTYSLYANSSNGTATYNIEVKSSSYNDLTTNLLSGNHYNWSMKFTAPSGFDAADDLTQKSATVTLVASEH